MLRIVPKRLLVHPCSGSRIRKWVQRTVAIRDLTPSNPSNGIKCLSVYQYSLFRSHPELYHQRWLRETAISLNLEAINDPHGFEAPWNEAVITEHGRSPSTYSKVSGAILCSRKSIHSVLRKVKLIRKINCRIRNFYTHYHVYPLLRH